MAEILPVNTCFINASITFFFVMTGGVLMFGALLLFDEEFVRVIDIAFTALLLTELLMVALTIRTWHYLMVVAQVFSIGIYIASVVILKEYFGKSKILERILTLSEFVQYYMYLSSTNMQGIQVFII